MNELDRYTVSLENMEVLREKVAEQAREIAVLKANVVTDNNVVLVNALAELERLKAQSGAVVPDSVVWIDAHHIQPGNNPSFIRDVALVSAVKTTETQVPLVRLNSSHVSSEPSHSEQVRDALAELLECPASVVKVVSTHRGYQITTDGTTFYAAGTTFNTAWSAIVYIDELLSL